MTLARLIVALALVASGAARAEAACTVTATAVTFGAYDVFQVSPTDSTGTITYRCGKSDRDIRIAISRGWSSTFSPRTLLSGGDVLSYNLFRDATFSQVWGDGSGGTATYFIRNPPNSIDVVLSVYGRIPAEQDVASGAYGDTVVVTLEY